MFGMVIAGKLQKKISPGIPCFFKIGKNLKNGYFHLVGACLPMANNQPRRIRKKPGA